MSKLTCNITVLFTIAVMPWSVSLANQKYNKETGAPATGYRSALKYFGAKARRPASESGLNEAQLPTREELMTLLLTLDTHMYIDNQLEGQMATDGEYGFGASLYWDSSWFAKGLEVDYAQYEKDKKLTLLAGLMYPKVTSDFPLYVKANVGMGYFMNRESAKDNYSIDYNVYAGARYFRNNFALGIELGSQNYRLLFNKVSLSGVVVNSGLSFRF